MYDYGETYSLFGGWDDVTTSIILLVAVIFFVFLALASFAAYTDNCIDNAFKYTNWDNYYDTTSNVLYEPRGHNTNKDTKIEVKTSEKRIEVVEETIKKTDIDGSPIKKFKPKKGKNKITGGWGSGSSTTSTTPTTTSNTTTHTTPYAKSVLVYYTEKLGNYHKIVYEAMLGYLASEIKDKRKLYHVVNSVYHVDAYSSLVKIYYRKCQTIYADYKFNEEEIIKAIRFAMDNSLLKVEFIQMENTSLGEYYLENFKEENNEYKNNDSNKG